MVDKKSSEDQEKRFEEHVRDKSKRRLKARRESQKGIWFGIGMFGLVGWSVAIPTLLFLAL
ncbi:MAG: ATP synthase subunit, partial [Balneolaceae bacterium]